MVEDSSTYVDRIREYLAGRGGSVSDAEGRGLGDEIARAIGADKATTVAPVLEQMERDGLITREMRGFRTYRIDLVPQNAAPPTAPAGDDLAAPPTAELTPVLVPASPADSLSPTPPVVVAPPPPASTSPTVPAGDVQASEAAPPPEAPARAISLRQALARRAAETPAAATTQTPVISDPTAPPSPGTNPTETPTAAGPAAPLWPGATTDTAVARGSGYVQPATPPPTTTPAGEPEAAARAAERSSRFAYLMPPVVAGPEATPGAAPTTSRYGAPPASVPLESGPDAATPRSRLTVAVPEVRRGPSHAVLIAVGAALVVMVIVAVISVIVTRGPAHRTPASGTAAASNDACLVVSPADATAAFGDNAGAPHLVLGSCVYDDGSHELIVAVARQTALAQFNAAHTSEATDVPGIGDRAYYVNGRLWVLKGSNLLLVTLTPFSPTAPSPRLVALATSAVARL